VKIAGKLLDSADPELSGSLGQGIDPCDMKCLNCIGEHCPGCPDDKKFQEIDW
jgi:hypothetical protein